MVAFMFVRKLSKTIFIREVPILTATIEACH